jgi:hypothetical protein
MENDKYVIKNMTRSNICLGDIRCTIKAGATVDLLKFNPELTLEKLLHHERNGSLGKRLEQKMLVKIEATTRAEKNDGLVERPTVFEEKPENIVFPKRVTTGVVMEEQADILEEEIIRKDELDEESLSFVRQSLTKNEPEKDGFDDSVEEVKVGPEPTEDELSRVKSDVEDLERRIITKENLRPVKAGFVSDGKAVAVIPQEVEEKRDEPDSRPAKLNIENEAGTITADVGGDKPKLNHKTVVAESDYDFKMLIDGEEVKAKERGPAKQEKENRCMGTNRFGKQCNNKPMKDSEYCMVHKMQAE